eukprot:5153925-Prymnesium_polylepis.1
MSVVEGRQPIECRGARGAAADPIATKTSIGSTALPSPNGTPCTVVRSWHAHICLLGTSN